MRRFSTASLLFAAMALPGCLASGRCESTVKPMPSSPPPDPNYQPGAYVPAQSFNGHGNAVDAAVQGVQAEQMRQATGVRPPASTTSGGNAVDRAVDDVEAEQARQAAAQQQGGHRLIPVKVR